MNEIIATQLINEFGRGTLVDSASKLISSWLFIGIVFAVVFLIVLMKDKKKAKLVLLAVVIALLLHVAITEGIFKGVIGFRERPYIAYPNEIIPIGNLSTDASFPSGHVSAVAAFCTALIFFHRKNRLVWIISIVAVLIMMFSRIHNGMHYPSDVLAGAVFGIVYGLAGVWAAGKVIKK